MTQPVFIGALDRGHYCMTDVGTGEAVAVPLTDIARRMQASGIEIGADVFEALPHLGSTEVGGKWWRKLKRKARKVARKVVKVAKKVAKSKLVRKAWRAAANAPAPYGTYFQAVETGFKFGKSLVPPKKVKKALRTARGAKKYATKVRRYKKAKRALPYVRKLAAGRISLKLARRANRKIGLKPNVIRNAAFAMKLKASPSKMAQGIIKRAASIERLGADTRRIKSKSGRTYDVTVKAA